MSHESSYESGQRFSKFKMADIVKLGASTDSEFGGSLPNDFCFSNSFQ